MLSFNGSISITSRPSKQKSKQKIENALKKVPDLVDKINKSNVDVEFTTDYGMQAQAGTLGGESFVRGIETVDHYVKRILKTVLDYRNTKTEIYKG